MTRPSLSLACLLLAAGGVAAQNGGDDPQPPQPPPQTYKDGIAAEVEGDVITYHDLELTCRLASFPSGDYRRMTPDQQLAEQHQQLTALIQERVLKLRADEENVKLTPEDQQRVDQDLDGQASRIGGRERLRLALQSEGIPLEFFRARIETNLLTTRLLLKHISRDVFVSPGEVRLYYDQHKDDPIYQVSSLLRIRQIRVFKDPISGRDERPRLLDEALKLGAWDARAYIDGLKKRIEGGESFEAVAREGSLGTEDSLWKDFTGSDTPGSTDWLSPKLAKEAESLEVGQLSLVIESETGSLHLLLVEDRRPTGRKPLGQVQREIEELLREATFQRRVRDWIDQAQRRAYVRNHLPPLPGGPGKNAPPPRGG